MASSDARPLAIKNTAYRIYFGIYKNDGTLITGASGLDSEVSLDGASYGDCTNEATEIGSSGTYYLDLTNTEINTNCTMLVVKTSSTGAVIPTFAIYPQEIGDILVNLQGFTLPVGAAPELGISDSGTAQSATGSVITIRSAATFATNTPVGQTIWFYGSDQGYWQSALIASSSGDAMTISPNAGYVTPTGTITYWIGLTAAGSLGDGSGFTDIPWNADWDAEVQSEVTDALNAYDGPTNTELATALGALNDISPAEVNAEVLDVLNVDTFAQPGQGTPAATNSIRAMIAYLYKAWRNRSTQTASAYKLYNDDASTVDQKATFSDDATTADKGEVATGP